MANRRHRDGNSASEITRFVPVNVNSDLLIRRNVGSLIWHINKYVIVCMLGSMFTQFNESRWSCSDWNGSVLSCQPRFGAQKI
jgi:hypothetical protein